MSGTITEAFGDPGMATPWTTPTRVKSRSGWLDTTRTCCPIRRCAAAKVPESTTTCSADAGPWPSTMRPGLRAGTVGEDTTIESDEPKSRPPTNSWP